MELFEAILSRRSIRSYTRQPIPADAIKKMLSAAMNAPSAGNQQPWHFIVMTDHKHMDACAEVLPNGKMLRQAAAGIIVCADLEAEKHKGYWVQDCSAAIQNLLLAAHAQGLGAVWLGVYPRDERVAGIKNLMALPENILPMSIISVGYPGEKVGPASRFNESKIHYEKW